MHVVFDELNDSMIERYFDDKIEEQTNVLNNQDLDSSINQENRRKHEGPTLAPPKGWKSITYHPQEQILGETFDQVRTG